MSDRMAALGPRCRHHTPVAGIHGGNECGIGHPIRKIVHAANGNSSSGIAFMLPCHPGPERKANCPSYDAQTPEELEAKRARSDAMVQAFLKRLPKIAEMKRKMVAGNLRTAKATCPWCEAKDAFKLSCNIAGNKHVHGNCSSCGEGFLE